MFRRQFPLGNGLPTHIRKNTNFLWQKPWQLPSAEANFKVYFFLKIFRFSCFSQIHKLQNLMSSSTLLHIYNFVVFLECYWVSMWNLITFLAYFSFNLEVWKLVPDPHSIFKKSYNLDTNSFLKVDG